MRDSTTRSHRQTSGTTIRKCKCGLCGDTRLTTPGTKCECGGLMGAYDGGEGQGVMRKAFGLEDTDLRKGGLR